MSPTRVSVSSVLLTLTLAGACGSSGQAGCLGRATSEAGEVGDSAPVDLVADDYDGTRYDPLDVFGHQ